MSQNRNWVFTLNNWTEEEAAAIRLWIPDHAVYTIFGREGQAEGATPHLQGYVQWVARRRLGFCRQRLARAHWEPALAPDAAVDYCKKEGDYEEHGCRSQAGAPTQARKRCLEAYQDGGAGAAAEAEPVVWAYSGHNLRRNVVRGAPHRPGINVRWLHGPTGSGKTRAAWAPWVEDHVDRPEPYVKLSTVKWWDGYCDQKEVIIDDLCPGGIGIHHLLQWFDRYPCQVELKGGMCPLAADTFVVTSNFEPAEVYPDTSPESIAALERRITKVRMTHD